MIGAVVDLNAYRAARDEDPKRATADHQAALDAAYEAGVRLSQHGAGLQFRAEMLTQFMAGLDAAVNAGTASGGAR